ncbi:acetyl-CoA acetyltransferase [Pedomonas sp. V897]|uniref:acetyl-CoA acetyltransferase n=1 Tax=Pedomonas sp. V897 TaxID=3446482 RepID=UPI003EE3237E
MMAAAATSPERTPVLIGVGELCDRTNDPYEALDSLQLMLASLEAAEQDAGVRLLDRLDWLGVEDQISFPMADPQERLAALLPKTPAVRVKTREASGDGPIQLLNDAANLIGRGEIRIAAIAGGEALRTAGKRAQAELAAGRQPPFNSVAATAEALATPLARRYGLVTPIDVYPLYENATRSAWGQSLDEAQAETALIWSGFSQVAANNPHAWLQRAVPPEDIRTVTDDNRLLSFPYTKLMVANAGVNMGAALLVTSLATARALGVAEDKIVHIGLGAAAHESDDFLLRDTYTRSVSLEATVTEALGRNGLDVADIQHVELYSCFPCVPKMARRVLGWPAERPATVYGGLTFGGAPVGNCMTHAVAQMARKLRADKSTGLVVANGGYATHSHSIVLSGRPLDHAVFPQDYSVQGIADSRRGQTPELLEFYEGPGTLETYTIPYSRDGAPRFATVIGRTPEGKRFVAHVPKEDQHMLDLLTCKQGDPIGTPGTVTRSGEMNIWHA